MNFLINWLINYVLVMFAMSVDNIFWISTSPEYLKGYKGLKWFTKGENESYILVENKRYYTKTGYIIKYRIWSVLTHWRDIIPAIMTSLIMTIIWKII